MRKISECYEKADNFMYRYFMDKGNFYYGGQSFFSLSVNCDKEIEINRKYNIIVIKDNIGQQYRRIKPTKSQF